ncbi:MAG: DNA polymerase-3 subunit epsilon [Psychromonas sp.]|jgi:DNA polymerase-3 subunit epsilon|uniref:3'-5' exonuclease n=1 Tax=Psychromonas sp. TaxID=1884585 RepID=UPI0039E283D6
MILRKLFNLGRNSDWTNFYQKQSHQSNNMLLQNFYKRGVTAPDLPIAKVKFVALDFETTGLDAKKDDIVSIGLVPFDLKRIYLNQAKQWLINPNLPLEKESVIIHGITHSDIVDAPDLMRILEEVLQALAECTVVVHYRKIEREFFDMALKERIGEGIRFPLVDTLAIESYLQAKETSRFINRLKGAKPGSVRLGSCRQRYGLPAYTPHHALTDAIATAELLQAQIAYHYSPDTPIGHLWK